ncbi:MAG TPA: hypothetical protein VFX15_04830 [Actinomycetes bacterium]|nr:hypothetical protein [Actinomycetes bacterium]
MGRRARLHEPSLAKRYDLNLWIGHPLEARRAFLVEPRRDSLAWNAGEEGTPMLSVVTDERAGVNSSSVLDEIVREGPER